MAVSLMITEGARDSESGTALLSHIYKVGRHLQVALRTESQPLSTRPALVDVQMDGALGPPPAWAHPPIWMLPLILTVFC